MTGNWTGLPTQTLCAKSAKPHVLPQKAGALQYLQGARTGLPPACGRERGRVLGGSLKKKDAKRLDKLVRKAGSVVGTELDIGGGAECTERASVHHRQY